MRSDGDYVRQDLSTAIKRARPADDKRKIGGVRLPLFAGIAGAVEFTVRALSRSTHKLLKAMPPRSQL